MPYVINADPGALQHRMSLRHDLAAMCEESAQRYERLAATYERRINREEADHADSGAAR
jgi:hypothetical protein